MYCAVGSMIYTLQYTHQQGTSCKTKYMILGSDHVQEKNNKAGMGVEHGAVRYKISFFNQLLL